VRHRTTLRSTRYSALGSSSEKYFTYNDAGVPEQMQGKDGWRWHGSLYPCHTCLPQEQCTVSVGRCLVSCCLQTGQGLVITGVIVELRLY